MCRPSPQHCFPRAQGTTDSPKDPLRAWMGWARQRCEILGGHPTSLSFCFLACNRASQAPPSMRPPEDYSAAAGVTGITREMLALPVFIPRVQQSTGRVI